ncbi:MAG: bleomycin resistance protein [Thalassovita sp.]
MSRARITANLPSLDFSATAEFYARLGFKVAFKNQSWMILTRGPLELEFFPHPEIDSKTSWFSACIRVDDLDGLLSEWQAVGLPSGQTEVPRLTEAFQLPDAPRMAALIDPDGSLLRILQNEV